MYTTIIEAHSKSKEARQMITNDFFTHLKSGDNAVSEEHGLVSVLFADVREGKRYVTCQTDDENETVFDAVEGELACPVEWQTNTAIYSCEARICNGADIEDSFKWLRDEIQKAHKGEFTYDFN